MLRDECTVEQAPRTDGRVHSCLIGPRRAGKGLQPKSADTGIRINVSPKPEQPGPTA